MLIFDNFISRYENFKSRDKDSSSTQNVTNVTRHSRQSVKESTVALTSPPPYPLGINYRRVKATGSIQSACDMLAGGCPGQVSSVCHRAAATATPSPVCCVSRWYFRPNVWPTLMLRSLTLWRPLVPYGFSYRASSARPLTLRAERQSARMSKITNYGLIRSGRGCLL